MGAGDGANIFSHITILSSGSCNQRIQVRVDGLDEFLQAIETNFPDLEQARKEIEETQSVSFYPGLGELFTPGSKLVCHPDGMEGSPLGCSCVQSWYAEELNKATGKKVPYPRPVAGVRQGL